MASSSQETAQFNMLPPRIRELIMADMGQNGSADGDATPFSFAMSPSAEVPRATTGAVFADDASRYAGTTGPLTLSDVAGIAPPQRKEATAPQAPEQGALTRTARAEPDFQAMLNKYVPEDDSSSRYLAMAAAFSKPTVTGSFGETMGNVANALYEQKQNQQKLRAQYTPLIMQQVAAQQSRAENQAFQAQQSELQRQQQMAIHRQTSADRAEAARLVNQSHDERAAADRASREGISADRLAAASSAEKMAGKAPPGYAWGAPDANGQPSMIAVKGGPADLKKTGVLNSDTQALTGAVSSFDRLASAANEVLAHPGLNGITGIRGKIPNVPGTDAANAEALLGTLKSQIGFGVLQDMRNNSKTGGALGSVSDAEGKRLEANLAALDKSQSVEQFKANLAKIVDYAEKAKDRMREAYNLKHSGVAAPAAPSAESGTQSLVDKYRSK